MRALDLCATVYAPPRAQQPWRLGDLFKTPALRLYGHGRQALAEALLLSGAGGGRVLLPSFICRDLLASVAAAGAKPAFYAVKADLTPAEPPERWPDAHAVLAVDYFGFPQDLTPFMTYARRCGAVVIEDAAHALFSRDATGVLLGMRAPLGILSLRKSLPLPDGGALLVNDAALAQRVPPQAPFAAPAGGRAALKSALRPWLARAGARATLAALSVLRALRGDAGGHIAPDLDSETILPRPTAPCLQLAHPLDCADPVAEATRRRALWAMCDAVARRAGLAPVFPTLPEGVVPYGYAFRAKDLAAARAPFAAEGLTTLPWPDLPAALLASAPAHHRDVGLVHFLW